MTIQEEVKITTSYSKEYSTHAAKVLCECFRHDPVLTWLTCTLTASYRQQIFPRIYNTLMHASHGGGSLFYEADSWSSCAVVTPPGKRIDGVWNMLRSGILGMMWDLGIGCVKRAIVEYEGASDTLRNQALGREESYYIFAVGTLDGHQGKGLCSAQMRQIQAEAAKTGHPVWLEATTPKSRDLYTRLGWILVDEIKLGVGKTGADGFVKEGGEGVTIWGMYWRPGEKEVE